ncbi:glycoside hydrolase/deacetylase [Westerdykella ornata]|uniref:Glycoside hydrolase/deacetylase n=1 Tax=Westerdykella ornata TaxID=318751 RepID=A0A6A6JA91_WESOR|nr:glycoside hydrolase/deacetylase [Westerdykella ornata]KAF2273520.1 glycoside hydrolase/deacetylase [Westerdykella ornata]
MAASLGRCLLVSLFALSQWSPNSLVAASPRPHAQPNGESNIVKRAVPYGELIYGCDVPGVIAPAFDDGPWIYTEDILDRMEAANFKATWFINGQNKDNIYKYNATLKRMIALGHQIGSHTWSHKDLATLTPTDTALQMTQLEEALVNILGYMPTYMRPPFLSYNQAVLDVMRDLQYVVIIGDLNTRDWAYQSATEIENAKQLFVTGLDQGFTIVEAHDQEEWTHGVLIDFMIQTVQQRGLVTVPVGACMGQSPSEWYRTARAPPPSGTVGIPLFLCSFFSTSPFFGFSFLSPLTCGIQG